MFQKIFLLGVLFLVSMISIHADTNGVWTYSEDIKAGVFGADEGNPSGSNYTFNEIVYFNQDLVYKTQLIEDMFVNTSGDTMSGNLDMDNNRITNLPSPTGSNQPTTLEYSDNNYVNEAGDSMSGNLEMGGNTISNINRLITNPSTSDYLGGVFAESYFTRGAGTSYYLRPAGSSIINNLDVIGSLELSGVDINDIFVNEGQSNSISNTMLQDNSVTGDKIAIGSVGGDELVSNYESGSVYDSRFVNEGQSNSISNTMLQDNSVTGDKIENNAITINEIDTSSLDNQYVNRAGDTMSGALRMNGNDISLEGGDLSMIGGEFGLGGGSIGGVERIGVERLTPRGPTRFDNIEVETQGGDRIVAFKNDRVTRYGGKINMDGNDIDNVGDITNVETINVKEICDENGNNCFEPSDVGSGNTYEDCGSRLHGEVWTEGPNCPAGFYGGTTTTRQCLDGAIKIVSETGSGCIDGRRCFTEETQVLMGDNSTKDIKDVMIGDIVLNENLESTVVTKLHKPIIGPRGIFTINGKIESTGDHPFKTTEGWKVVNVTQFNHTQNSDDPYKSFEDIELEGLEVGDILITANGEEEIKSITWSDERSEDEFVYSFSVAEGEGYWADGYLVKDLK